MADIRITELPYTSNINGGEFIIIDNGAITSHTTINSLSSVILSTAETSINVTNFVTSAYNVVSNYIT